MGLPTAAEWIPPLRDGSVVEPRSARPATQRLARLFCLTTSNWLPSSRGAVDDSADQVGERLGPQARNHVVGVLANLIYDPNPKDGMVLGGILGSSSCALRGGSVCEGRA